MSQQLVNGSHYKGAVTITYRQSDRYAVVNPPEQGKHRKTQAQRERRHVSNEFTQLINKLNQRKKATPR